MNDKFILSEDGERPIRCDNIFEWAKWFETHQDQKRVANDCVGCWYISTVFLALNYRFGNGDPLLWETMVFKTDDSKPGHDHEMDRCGGNREQALAMHQSMVERVQALDALDGALTE